MKLTKDVVEVLKYHGYMTFTESTETFLQRFDTVEELGDAGFITDRGAIDFLKTVFDENGVNKSAEVSEEELEKQATETPIVEEPTEPEKEPESTPEPVVETPAAEEPATESEPSEEPAPETPAEPEKEPEPVKEEETPTEKPKTKKTTTTKKTTKKES